MMDSQKLKKKPSFNEDGALRGAWRRLFSRSPVYKEVLMAGRREVPRYNKDGSRHKVDSVQYSCQVCNQWVAAKFIEVDHIIPVIDIDDVSGKVKDWNVYKKRLFCEKNNLQRICDPCHDIKTFKERQHRQALKDKIALDPLAEQVKSVVSIAEAKDLKKQLKKFTTKTKSEEIRNRAEALLLKLKDLLERQD